MLIRLHEQLLSHTMERKYATRRCESFGIQCYTATEDRRKITGILLFNTYYKFDIWNWPAVVTALYRVDHSHLTGVLIGLFIE